MANTKISALTAGAPALATDEIPAARAGANVKLDLSDLIVFYSRPFSICDWRTVPDTTGECFPEPYDVVAASGIWKQMVWRFGSSNAAQPTVRHGIYGAFKVPANYVAGANVRLFWVSSITTGAVVWDLDYRAVAVGESLNQGTAQQAVTVTDTAAGTAHLVNEASLDLTDANLAANDLVTYYLARDGVDAADTMAGAALLVDAQFEWT